MRRTALGRGHTRRASWSGVASPHAHGEAVRCEWLVEANRVAGWADNLTADLATPRAVESSHVPGRSEGADPLKPRVRARTGGSPGAGRSESPRPLWVPGAGATTTGKSGKHGKFTPTLTLTGKPLVATGRHLRAGQT